LPEGVAAVLQDVDAGLRERGHAPTGRGGAGFDEVGVHERDPALHAGARPDRRGVARRALLATLAFAGLRVGELCALLWRDVDLAAGRLAIRQSKTGAGVRYVNLLPGLRDELDAHKARAVRTGAHDPVFATPSGRARDKDNVRNRILRPTVKRANEPLEEDDQAPLPDGLTPHSFRRTFASILVALGDDPRDGPARAHRPGVHAEVLRPGDAPQRRRP
jgi:integrase